MNQFTEEYFLRGRDSGLSLYDNYRWMPELTIPMVRAIIEHLGLDKRDHILDFGCARGYVVRAFHELGFRNTLGVDISEWAIENCDPSIKKMVFHLSSYSLYRKGQHFPDWVIAKDVLEHVDEVANTVDALMTVARKGVFAVVPLSMENNTHYVVSEYEKDVTHVHRLNLSTWAKIFMRPGWSVTASYMVAGIKDNYQQWQWGNGFLTARRNAK